MSEQTARPLQANIDLEELQLMEKEVNRKTKIFVELAKEEIELNR